MAELIGVSVRSIGRVEQSDSAGMFLRQLPKLAGLLQLTREETLARLAPPPTIPAERVSGADVATGIMGSTSLGKTANVAELVSLLVPKIREFAATSGRVPADVARELAFALIRETEEPHQGYQMRRAASDLEPERP